MTVAKLFLMKRLFQYNTQSNNLHLTIFMFILYTS